MYSMRLSRDPQACMMMSVILSTQPHVLLSLLNSTLTTGMLLLLCQRCTLR
jgi:hypothetical protein